MKILVTGGAGFIGSHTVVELLNAGHDVVVVDNLCNSSRKSLARVKKITGREPAFYKVDIRDERKLNAILDKEAPFGATIHFAALKAVGESTKIPLKYYNNNLGGTFTLLKCLGDHNCKNIVFSSSATVYGDPKSVPIREDFPTPGCTNAYGWTKLMMEQVFKDVQKADPAWNVVLLRYFNPIGAHKSGLIGEDPAGIPNNLLPFVAQVAVGRRPELSVFGNDYPTPDGTGIRDYIHVVDLAVGHLKAIEKIARTPDLGLKIYNLGTGNGYSVLQVVKAFEKASGRPVPYKICPRRPGDIAECWADPALAAKELGWKAERGIDEMCEDAWRWQSQNPYGFNPPKGASGALKAAKKACLAFALGCCAAFGALAAGDYPIRSADLTKVKVTGGFWQSRLATNRVATLKGNFRKCEETHRIANFVDAGKRLKGTFKGIPFNDSDVFKVMEAAAYMIALEPDPELEKYMDWLIGEIGKAQEADGYLYTARTLGYSSRMMGRTRWSNVPASHELYNIGHMYEAAVAWYEATGKDNFLKIARKSADLVDKVFGPGPNQRKDAPGHEEIELALVKLYRVTGEKRYLNLAKHFLDVRGATSGKKAAPVRFTQAGDLVANTEMKEPGAYAQNHRPAADQREAVGHAVRAGYLYCAMADVAALTGEKRYVDAITAIWNDVACRKLHLNGGIGARHAGEAFGAPYELPNASAYLETCAAIANALWNERLFRTTGEAKYMDVVERVIYNGFLSGISLSGVEYFYPNPLASTGGYKRSLWFGCSCCPVNIVRFIPQIPRMAYATDGKGTFYVNLFLASEAEMDGVKFKTETDYPWNGKVKITVTPKRAGDRFAVKVRVPGWARGKPVPSDLYTQVAPATFENANGYRVYDRAWQPGDTIEIEFPMNVQRIRAHANVVADRGRLAVERGPILYCAEGADNGGRAFNAVLPLEETFADDTVTIGDRTFPTLRASGGLKLIPYFAWDHRQPGNEMQVWPQAQISRNNRFGWGVLASHCHSDDAVDALLDGVTPSKSSDETIPRFTVWPRLATEEWVEFRLPQAETLKGFDVYWFRDLPKGRCDLPASWKVQSRASAGAAWVDVPGAYPVAKDRFCRGAFAAPVTATAFRIVAQSKPKLSGGILEVKPVK